VRLGETAVSSIQVLARLAAQSGAVTQTIPFAPGQISATLSVHNPQPVISETVQISLNAKLAQPQNAQEITSRLGLTFINPQTGDSGCFLCYADWLLKLMGIDTIFWRLHHLSFPSLENSLSWQYYDGVFNSYEEELSHIVATHPALLWQTFGVLESWTPGLVMASDGEGHMAVVSDGMVDDAEALLLGLQTEASPALANRIEAEMTFLDLDAFRGLTMTEALQKMEEQVQSQVFLPAVLRE
jgi:hypothetical protein